MHEASIAQSILDIAISNAEKDGALKISKVAIRVGVMAAVEESSLRFALDAIKIGTIAENSEFEFEIIKLKGRCLDCNNLDEYDRYFSSCKKCGSNKISMVSGDELQIAYIEVD